MDLSSVPDYQQSKLYSRYMNLGPNTVEVYSGGCMFGLEGKITLFDHNSLAVISDMRQAEGYGREDMYDDFKPVQANEAHLKAFRMLSDVSRCVVYLTSLGTSQTDTATKMNINQATVSHTLKDIKDDLSAYMRFFMADWSHANANLTSIERATLKAIIKNPSIRQYEIGKAIGKHQSAVSAIVSSMKSHLSPYHLALINDLPFPMKSRAKVCPKLLAEADKWVSSLIKKA